jgi:hypothetical protein
MVQEAKMRLLKNRRAVSRLEMLLSFNGLYRIIHNFITFESALSNE